MEPAYRFVVAATEAGQRLDVYLGQRLALSRRYVQRLLRGGRIRIAGRPAREAARKGAILREGDRIEVLPFRDVDAGPLPDPDASSRLRIVAESGGLVAVDKPAGMPTHPLDLDESGTALNALLVQRPGLAGIGEGGVRSGVVHRLDTDTSGVLVLATAEQAWQRARRAFAERRVSKRYLARVHGNLHGTREVALRLDHRGRRMRVVARGGREALTQLRPLAADLKTTLVEVRPISGLMHQIRVTLAHLGHPVLGDRLYGSSAELGRHLLHATDIQIDDFVAHAEPPPELGV